MHKLTIETTQQKQIIDITQNISNLLKQHPAKDGIIHIFLRHTTAALTTAYLPDDIDLDILGALETMIPQNLSTGEHTHHTTHLPAHITGTLIGASVTIPVQHNTLLLGTFQSVILIELQGPKQREIIVHYKPQI